MFASDHKYYYQDKNMGIIKPAYAATALSFCSSNCFGSLPSIRS